MHERAAREQDERGNERRSAPPRAGRVVAVTRARDDCAVLAGELEARELAAMVTPLLRFSMSDPALLAQRVRTTPPYDWMVCTSRHAVFQLEAACRTVGLAPADAGFARVGAVGEETGRALEGLGLTVHLRPSVSDASHLALAMLEVEGQEGGVSGSAPRVLFPRAAAARDELPSLLRAAHWIVDDIACYETLPCAEGAAELTQALAVGAVDVVTLASGSAARAMASLVPETLWPSARLVSIGPTTTAAASAAGLTIVAEAPHPAMGALAETAHRVLLDTLTHA